MRKPLSVTEPAVQIDSTPDSSPYAPQPYSMRHRRAETIASDLRAMIMNNILPIGQKLPTETMLCHQYDVSRTTLREAIQMLRSAGMLDVTPGRGSFVKAPHISSLIPALQLAGRSRGFSAESALMILNVLAQQGLQQTVLSVASLREASLTLNTHLVPRNADASTAAQTEGHWYLAVLQMAGLPLYDFMAQILIPLFSEARRAYYKAAGPDAILRTLNLQLRFNAAVAEGDTNAACRMLQNAMQPPAATPAAKPQAA